MSEYIIRVDENDERWHYIERQYTHFFGYPITEEIVRCRDCKWFTPEHRYEEEREYGVMEELVEPPDCGNPERCSHHYDSITGKVVPVHIVTDPDGFCAWGERRAV